MQTKQRWEYHANYCTSTILLQVVSMVATPSAPSGTSSTPFTQDEFNSVVQKTYGRYPLTIVRGSGCLLYDSNGKVWCHVSRILC